MRNTLSIMRRDLAAYFTSPIGYIYLMVFVTVSVGLYVTGFFSGPILVIDMRPFFENLPLMLCIFIPAVTMRVWAEERKENTWEMLLTFPMRAYELVLGKYLAALTFFGITLAATVTVPVMLFWLGNPDAGVILGGYVGTALVGATFLAMGIFFSGFFKDQIVAFVVTLLACFIMFLVGTNFIASYLDGIVRDVNLGSLLSQLLGVFTHFSPFTRGVVDAIDIIFFGAWISIFLGLNIMYVDGRSRPKAGLMFGLATVFCVVIGLMLNWLAAGSSLKRFDLSEEKVNTVADASKKVLQDLEAPVQVTYYVTPKAKIPTQLQRMEEGVVDKLEELRVASNSKLRYKTVYLEASNVVSKGFQQDEEDKEKTEEEKIEERMLDKGVEPFSVQVMGQTEAATALIYSALGVAYAEKPEEIIPRIVPDQQGEMIPADLEYRLISTVYKLTRDKKPTIALVAPREAVYIDPQQRAMFEQLGQRLPPTIYDDPYEMLDPILRSEKYEVRRVEFTKEEPLPDEYDTLVVVNPRALNDRQRYEINRALRAGKSVILAVQNYTWQLGAGRRGYTANPNKEDPQVNTLLEQYGLGVSDDVLMDQSNLPISLRMGNSVQEFAMPFNIVVQSSTMDQSTPITDNLSSIFYLWGTALNTNQQKLDELGLKARPLMTSSPKSWTIPGGIDAPNLSFEPPADPSQFKSYPLMAHVKGQFPDAFAGKERPQWPEAPQQPENPMQPKPPTPEEGPETPVEAKPGELILMGCSQMFHKNSMQAANLQLFLKIVDSVTLSEEIAEIRSKVPSPRTMNKPESTFAWQFINYVLASLVIAGVGIGSAVARRSARNAYTMSFAAARNR